MRPHVYAFVLLSKPTVDIPARAYLGSQQQWRARRRYEPAAITAPRTRVDDGADQ